MANTSLILKHFVKTASAACLLALVVLPAGKGAKSPDASPMLERAAELTNLENVDAIPHCLRARFKFSSNYADRPSSGFVSSCFASQFSWRDEIKWAAETSVEMAQSDHIWRKDVVGRRLDLLRIDRAMHFSKLLSPQRYPPTKVAPTKSRNLNGVKTECVSAVAASSGPILEACLDRRGLPVRIKDFAKAVELKFGPEFFSLDSKFYPKSIQYSENDHVILELFVDNLEVLTEPSQVEALPPAGAASLPWCADEKPPSPMQFSNSRDFQVRLPGASTTYASTFPVSGFSLIVFIVRANGEVEDVKIYDQHGSLQRQDGDAEKLRNSIFRPASCGSKPVEGEFIIWPADPKSALVR